MNLFTIFFFRKKIFRIHSTSFLLDFFHLDAYVVGFIVFASARGTRWETWRARRLPRETWRPPSRSSSHSSSSSRQKQVFCHIADTQASPSEGGIVTLLALKLQVRSRYCNNYWRLSNSSRQKQVFGNIDGTQASPSEAGIATLLALKLQNRSRYCNIAGTQASGQKQVLPHC